jgi:hypothetical protein
MPDHNNHEHASTGSLIYMYTCHGGGLLDSIRTATSNQNGYLRVALESLYKTESAKYAYDYL